VRKYRSILWVLPVLLVFSAFAQRALPQAATPPQAAPAQRQIEWDKVQVKVQKLAPNVYVLQSSGVNAAISNVGVLVSDEGLAMVDCGYAELGPKFQAAIRTISDKPVKYVLNTHWHGDHTGGDAFWGPMATVIAHDNARKKMMSGGKLFPPSLAVALPVITFSDEFTLHMAAGDLHAVHIPHGHTDTDSLVLFPGNTVVSTGDDFVNWEVPGFPAIEQDTDGSGGAQGLIALAEYVLAHTPADVKIIPGHGVLASRADLTKELAVLKDTTAAVKAGIAQGKTLDQMKQEKAFAKWDYLNESHHIQSDVYFERLYKSLSQARN
jgi:cyclase